MEILIRKFTAKAIFKPHYNSATNQYYRTKKEYVSDLRAKGLEPAPKQLEHPQPAPLHKPSSWSRSMVETIKQSKQPNGSVRGLGSRFYDELNKRGVKARPCP